MAAEKQNPFEFINSITMNKVDMIRGSESPEAAEKAYVPYMANRQLSYFVDTVMEANEMNRRPDAPNIMQYEYLLHSVSRKKRFSKWAKAVKDEDVNLVCQYYGYSRKKAEEALKILTSEQLEVIREKLDTGG